MLQMNVLKLFWSHRVFTATYHVNRLPSRVLNFKSHFDVLQLDLSHLKVFGCIFFMYLPTTHRDKLDSRAIKCIFQDILRHKKSTNVMIMFLRDYMSQQISSLLKIPFIFPH